MKRFLVVANQTLGGEELQAAIQSRIAAGASTFHVLVPATPRQDRFRDAVNAYAGTMPDEIDAVDDASDRLAVVLEELRSRGAIASGEVGDPDPLVAIERAVAAAPYDEIILSTLPPGVSRWLARDLVHRVERSVAVPLCHVVTRAAMPQ